MCSAGSEKFFLDKKSETCQKSSSSSNLSSRMKNMKIKKSHICRIYLSFPQGFSGISTIFEYSCFGSSAKNIF